MKNKVIGLWVIILALMQFLFSVGITIYQYILMGYSLFSFSVIFDILSLIFVPGIFLLIGAHIRNK
jgi:hypothetical protein